MLASSPHPELTSRLFAVVFFYILLFLNGLSKDFPVKPALDTLSLLFEMCEQFTISQAEFGGNPIRMPFC